MRIPLKDTLARASIRKRLWLGAGAVGVFIGTLFVALILKPTDPNYEGKVGLDFIAFYTAGSFVREGHSADLYDIKKVQKFQYKTAQQNGADIGNAVGPWWNPPFYAWVFVPLARFPYRQALGLWVVVNVICAAVAAAILCTFVARAGSAVSNRSTARASESNSFERSNIPDTDSVPEPPGWRSWALVPVLIVLSVPFIHALSHAQNTCTSLLLVTLVVVCWRNQRAIAAGLVTGLLFYKPQLGAVLTVMVVLSLGWRTLIGLTITGTALLAATLVLPGSLHDFLHQMPRNLHLVQYEVPYLWDRHVTFKAFWRLLIQGTGAGEPTLRVMVLSSLCSGAIGLGLLWAALRVRRDARSVETRDSIPAIDPAVRRDRVIAATIVSTPLLMPFYFDYDQLLLAVPAVLLAVDFIRRDHSAPLPRIDRWLLRIWPIQYAWLMVNPDVAMASHVNIGVLLLAAVASLLIVRAWRTCDVSAANKTMLNISPMLKPAM